MKGNRIVIPKTLQNEKLQNFGIVKIKSRARDIMFWPGMNSDIVRTCDACQQYQKRQQRETYIAHEIPDIPWIKVGTDLCKIFSKSYLVLVDYISIFFDISEIPDKRSSTVVLHTKRIFSRYGIPKEVVSDNGPKFIGNAYKKFSKKWDFKHTTSSPVHPQSNGQVERTIQTIKTILYKKFENNEDPYLALLSIQSAHGPSNNTPPTTLFFNRTVRTIIPSVNETSNMENNKVINQQRYPVVFKRPLPELQPNDLVNYAITPRGGWKER